MADFRLALGPERIERENRRTGVRVGARYEEGTLNDYLPAVVGLLLLIGVVVNNGIVMIEHINQYRRRGWSAPRRCCAAAVSACVRS